MPCDYVVQLNYRDIFYSSSGRRSADDGPLRFGESGVFQGSGDLGAMRDMCYDV